MPLCQSCLRPQCWRDRLHPRGLNQFYRYFCVSFLFADDMIKYYYYLCRCFETIIFLQPKYRFQLDE